MIPLDIVVVPIDIVQKVIFWAAIVGTLGTFAQAIIQRPSMNPKIKAVITVVLAVLLGTSSFLLSGSWNGSFEDLDDLLAFIVGAYGAIQLAYQALKRPVIDELEANAGNTDPTPVPIDQP